MSDLGPLTGSDPSTLSVSVLTERLAMERAIRESEDKHLREIREISLAHEREIREAKELSVEKERQTQFNEYERRLEDLNHAHDQAIEAQAKTVPREMFEAYVKETSSKLDTAFQAQTEKVDAQYSTAISRHDSDIENVRRELQNERESRKSLEGSIATWKYIVGLLGASGLGAVLLFFINS